MNAVLAEVDRHGAWLEPVFDLAFGAPGGIARLRQLILTLAIQGKLVQQLASEAPASTLLKQIATEKAASVGKGRQAREVSPISDSEKPYTIPDCWEWVRLGEVTDIIRGITFPASEKTKEPAKGRIACLRTANVQKEIEWGDLLYIDRKFMLKSSQLVRRDDIVMSMANSRELVGKVAIVRDMPVEEATFGGFLGVLRTHKVIPLFLLHLLNTKYARSTLVDAASQTTNIANISLAKLNPFLIPLPPLEEQKRVVARIDELMSRCDELESQRAAQEAKRGEVRAAAVRRWLAGDDAAAALLGENFAALVSSREDVAELRKAILQLAVMGKLVAQEPEDTPASELLKRIADKKAALVTTERVRAPKVLSPIGDSGHLYAIPNSWKWVRLGELMPEFQNGLAKRGALSGKETTVLRLADVTSNRISLADTRAIKLSDDERKKYALRPADILVTRVNGSADIVGSFTACSELDGSVAYCDHFIRVRFMPDSVSTEFLIRASRTKLVRRQIEGMFVTTAGQKTVNQTHISSLVFPFPPLEEQQRIVARIDALICMCDSLEHSIDVAQAKQIELLDAVLARV